MQTARIKVLILGITFLSALQIFAGTARAIPTVSLTLENPVIYVGIPFNVKVIVDGVLDYDPIFDLTDEVAAFGFSVDYETTRFTYLGATVDVAFDDLSNLLPSDGVAGLIPFPSSGPGGNGIILASLLFTPLEFGIFDVGILSDLDDPNQGLFTLLYPQLDMSQSIAVNVNPVPEPTTFALVSAGLAGLAALRRRSHSRRSLRSV